MELDKNTSEKKYKEQKPGKVEYWCERSKVENKKQEKVRGGRVKPIEWNGRGGGGGGGELRR